jgi:hypothetical protein
MFAASSIRSLSMAPTAVRRRIFHSTTKSLKASIPENAARRGGNSSNSSSNAATRISTATTTTSSSSSTSWAKNHPFAFQLIVATGKTMAADLVTQVVAERRSWDEIDWKRNGIFVVFGFSYLGGFQYWLMVHKYRQWFPTMDRFAKLRLADKVKDTAGLLDAAKMVVFDLLVHMPIMYFPTYYTVKEFVGGHSWNPVDWCRDGLTKYAANFREDYGAMVQLWGPSDCVQFALPVHIRLPFRHFVSFFWTAYVSFTRGQIDEAPAAITGTAEGHHDE